MSSQSDAQPKLASWLALFAVWIFWGTTYLGIRIALESFPPALLLGLRFTLSGSILLIAGRFMGVKFPAGRELLRTCCTGLLTLGIGTGCLSAAEQFIPSGLAALFVTTAPFWMIGIDALIPGGERFHKRVLWGMFIGLLGTLLLLVPSGPQAAIAPAVVTGFLILQFGNMGWCLGSILQRRNPTTAHPIVSGAVQQFTTGILYLIPGYLLQGHEAHWNSKGISAILYLATFGSIVGYSAFLYALDTLPLPLVTTYNYVNPAVAVVLGWLFYNEPLGPREWGAMAIIFAGVYVVRHMQSRKK